MDETELSKQSLANQGASGIANIGAGWENRRTDSLLEGTKYTADVGKEKILGGTPEEQAQLNFRALIRSPWAKDRTPEEIQQAYSSMTSGKNHVEPSPEQGLKPVGGTIQTQTTPAPAPQTITNPAPTTSNTPGILDAVGSALNPRFIPQSHSYTAPLSQMTAAPGIAPMLNSPSEIAKNRANLDQATKDAQQEEEKRKKNKKNLSTGFNF